jgi:hypothetical protein
MFEIELVKLNKIFILCHVSRRVILEGNDKCQILTYCRIWAVSY